MAGDAQTPPLRPATPNPALKRLERLVGTWKITGRTPDAEADNIHGRVTIDWLPGGFFLQQRGEITFMGVTVYSLEVVGFDPSTQAFSAHVFSNLGEAAARYYWDVQGDVVTHWTDGSKYTGTFNEDGTVLAGGWRPDAGREGPDNVGYDAIMARVDGE